MTADGSGGTHAGLVAGLGDHALVLGVDAGTRPDLRERVPEQAAEAAAAAGLSVPVGEVQRAVAGRRSTLPALFARTYADWVREGPPPG